jgi:hypothetical protein
VARVKLIVNVGASDVQSVKIVDIDAPFDAFQNAIESARALVWSEPNSIEGPR